MLLQHKPSVSPNQEGRSIIHFAAQESNAACRRELIGYAVENGVDINAKTVYGWTPLIMMAWSDCSEAMAGMEILLGNGADVNATNKVGRNALHKAIDSKRWLNVQKLLMHKASYLGCDRYGNTILHAAARFACIDTFNVLFEHGLMGLDVTARDKKVCISRILEMIARWDKGDANSSIIGRDGHGHF